jgi:hypothetical protein
MPIVTLTIEKVQELMRQRDQKLDIKDELKKKTTKQLWLEDLSELEVALNERDKLRKQEDREEKAKIQKARAKAGFKSARRAAKLEEESKGLKRGASSIDKGGQAAGSKKQKNS